MPKLIKCLKWNEGWELEMSLRYLLAGRPFHIIVEGFDGADVSVPSNACTLSQAIDDIKDSYGFDGIEIERIEQLPFGKETLILVYPDESQPPSMLLLDPEEG